jgi:hypothetical protein
LLATLLVRPDLVATIKGLLRIGYIPRIPDAAPADFNQSALTLVAITFGYIGGSVMTYLVYPSFIAVHRWGLTGHPKVSDFRQLAAVDRMHEYLVSDPASVQLARRAVRPIKWDIAVGAVVLFVVTASFMMAGAAVLFPLREAGVDTGRFSGWRLLTDQAAIWSTIHPSLVWVYYTCAIAALWGTLQGYPDIYSRCITEYSHAISPQLQWRQQSVKWVVCIYVFVTTLFVIWSDVDFNTLTLIVAFLATNLGVAIAMFAGLYLNLQLPPLYRTSRPMFAAGIISAVILSVVTVVTGADMWTQIVGALSKAH